MIRYVGSREMADLLRREGPEAILRRLIASLRADFLRWPEFDLAPRLASHSAGGVIELMPIADAAFYSFKFVNGHPGNTRLGKQTVVAFGVLADVATGYPLLICEMSVLTALRTAATSALAACHLARPESRSMALIGTGAQAEFQALAFRLALGIDEIRLFDLDPAAMAKARTHLEGHGLKIVCAKSVDEAVAGADIVTTATADKTRATILTPDLVEPGQHLNAIGGDCPGKTELHPDIVARARTIVEYEPQSRIEGRASRCPRIIPSPSCGACCAATHRAASAATRSPCSTRSGSRWRIFQPCASCGRSRVPGRGSISFLNRTIPRICSDWCFRKATRSNGPLDQTGFRMVRKRPARASSRLTSAGSMKA
ncbi:hypothetical protein GCM10025880_59240 [Methylorubrum aminovorans]|nr:hypothetical protein GCM10025880_59240 [Methylorubrum aminovorans]